MKILVTGCLGFIGSNLTAHLLNEGHEVVGFDNGVNASINPTDRIKARSGQNWANFKLYRCDIRDLNTMLGIAVNYKPDVIVHLAALGSVPRSFDMPSEVFDVNVSGFANVCRLAKMMNCERLIFASSSSVYGDDPNGLRTEERIGNPLSPYALSKLNNEQFAEIWCKNAGLKYIGLRFFNVYGAGQLPDSQYSAVIPKFLNDPEIIVNGDGSISRDFTYVDDVCEAIELSLTTEKTDEVYNVGTGHETTIKDLAMICSRGKKVIKFLGPRHHDVKRSVAAPFKAQIFLKFTASYDIERGIGYTMKYYDSLKGIHDL